MEFRNLQSLLSHVALSCPNKGLIIHRTPDFDQVQRLSYARLLHKSRAHAIALNRIHGYRTRIPVLIYLEDQLDAITCFWASLFADLIPVMVPRMSDIKAQRHGYIASLDELLNHPIWITSTSYLSQLPPELGIKVLNLESILSWLDQNISQDHRPRSDWTFLNKPEENALFMLTSGSTGTPKAVCLTHRQLLTSIQGKLSMRHHPSENPFLNWIGLDHVASIVEIHLTAMIHEVDQVLVKAIHVILDPLLFVKLLSSYQVSRTFAPNFFLAKLLQTIQACPPDVTEDDIDLKHLMWLGSGGEANDVDVGTALSNFMSAHGSRPDVLVPGFGMTETCAGAIYNMDCPRYDINRGNTYTALGSCIPGIEMRVVHSSTADQSSRTTIDRPGDLEVRGDVLFAGYYNNPQASEDAFTPDGWFRTGDQATIDLDGILNLVGRAKDTVIINGINFFLHEIESIVAAQTLPHQPSRVVCFPFRRLSASTESICIIYVLEQQFQTLPTLVTFIENITQAVVMHTGAIPQIIALPDESKLHVTSLGKVSRNKLRTLYQDEFFREQIETQKDFIAQQRIQSIQSSVNPNVASLLEDIHAVLQLPPGTLGASVGIFEVGMTSLDIFRLKNRIEQRRQIEIPLTTILSNPSAESMAPALEAITKESSIDYDPIVVLRQGGTRAPLWLLHPGVGEVLVFLALSRYITDRPVYALRARGFDGQPGFSSISETISTYCATIKHHQPHGPYAIAGYSYGSMLAFEITKVLEANNDDEVRFLGCFNLPPHIKQRMAQMNWIQCLLHLCFFLDLCSENNIDEIPIDVNHPRDEIVTQVSNSFNQSRLQTLALDHVKLKRWTDIAYGLQSMAIDYEPSGMVSSIDVFHAEPLKVAASSRKEWVERHLEKWADFTSTEPRFHEVGGAHYTMLAPEHVADFAKSLERALNGRGM